MLRKENILNNKYDREFALNKCIIDFYYSIHQDIKVDKDVALLFSIGSNYEKLSPSSKTVKGEILKLGENPLISYLAKMLGCIDLPNENGFTKYTLNRKRINDSNRTFNILANQNNRDSLTFKGIGPTLRQLLKKQNSNKFEERIINNTYYSAPQKENECKPNFIINYAADYFFMEQKLFNSIKTQADLIIAAVLTIVIVYALFQLLKSPQDPPHSAVNGAVHENLMQSHAKQI